MKTYLQAKSVCPRLLGAHLLRMVMVLVLLATGSLVNAQTPVIKGMDKTLGGSDDDKTISVVTNGGGSVLGGYSNSDASYDKSQNSNGSYDYWVAKIDDANGKKVWDKTLGANGDDRLTSMIRTADKGYLLGGYSDSNKGGDKSQNSNGYRDYWVVKIDASGNKVWDKTLGGAAEDFLTSLVATADGGYLLGGSSTSNVGGDKTQYSNGDYDYWVVKIDANGNKVWDKTLGGNSDDELTSVIATADGGFLLGGSSSSNPVDDKSQDSKGGFDYWVVKIDANGNKIWDKTLGGNGDDELASLIARADGGFLLGGSSSSNVGGDKSQNSNGNYDYWVVKIDASGNKIWDKTLGGNSDDGLTSMVATADGGFLLGGSSDSNKGGDKSQNSNGNSDYWVVEIDANGNKVWDKTLGGAGDDELTSMVDTADEGFLLVGYSDSNKGGDKSQNSNGDYDSWWIFLNECLPPFFQITATSETISCAVSLVTLTANTGDYPSNYQWNTGATTPSITVTEAGEYSVQVSNNEGCASSGSKTINVDKTAPTASLTASSELSCANVTVTLTAVAITGATYTFSQGATQIGQGNTATVTQPGVYSVVVSSSGGCTASASVEVSGNATASSHPDYQPLVDLYNSTNGASWTNKTGWLGGCDPCSWYGVSCSDGRVTGLGLQSNGLRGSIPESLGRLTNLQQLTLFNNQLSGSIPESLGNLTNLQLLALQNNQLSGSLPESLGSLTNVYYILLEDNQLSGSIPASLGKLTNLQKLTLFNNQLSDSIPENVGSLANLRELGLQNNQLSGSLPASLGRLTNLRSLHLNKNQLSGCYPTSLTALCGVAIKDFSENAGLPGGGSAETWATFCATGQGGDGFVPTLTASSELSCANVTVTLTAVAITGATYTFSQGATQIGQGNTATVTQPGVYSVVVSSSGGCTASASVEVSGNATASSHPDYQPLVDLYNSTNGASWTNKTGWLGGCDPCSWYGVSCSDGRVTGLGLQSNGLRGSIPASLSGLINLQSLDLQDNGLAGNIPESLGNLTSLQELNLNDNQLSGSIPTSLGNLSNLQSLGLQDNGFSGNIPESLGNLTNLQVLDLQENQLSGSIPQTLANLKALRELDLQGNQLSGNIPASLGSLTNLQELDLQSNGLKGSIPESLGSLANLQELDLQDNELSGSIPASLGNLTKLQSILLHNNGLSGCYPASLTALCEVSIKNFSGNAGLPGGGSADALAAFCASGQGGDGFVPTVTASGALTCDNPVVTLTTPAIAGATYRFSEGAIQISGSNTAEVTMAGSYSVVVTTAEGCSATAQITVEGSCVSVPAKMSISHLNGNFNLPRSNTIRPYLHLVNEGSASVAYSEITIRYWITLEDFSPLMKLSAYSAQWDSDKVRMKYVELPAPRQGALGYIEYSFDASAGRLAANSSSQPIESSISKQNGSYLAEPDDYSYAKNNSYTKTDKITVYQNGSLIWGAEPREVAPVQKLKVYSQNRSKETTDTISTYVKVFSEGNVPVPYQDLTVRYWLTDESASRIFTLDYAWLGKEHVKAKIVKLDKPRKGASSYLELSFDPGVGQLYPLSNTGHIEYRFTKTDGSTFNQKGDYSYQRLDPDTLLENNRMTVYLAGKLMYGTEPPSSLRESSGPPANSQAAAEPQTELKVTLLGNPVQGNKVSFEVEGAQGQPLRLLLTNLKGQVIQDRQVLGQQAREHHQLSVGDQAPGMMVLRVSTSSQWQTVRVLIAQ